MEVSMPDSIGNAFMKAILNSPLHSLLGDRFAVVTVEGRKTGKQYATPINVTRDGSVFTATGLKNKTWWRNLRGGRSASLHVSFSFILATRASSASACRPMARRPATTCDARRAGVWSFAFT
jgi:hypothetical protein